MVFFFSFYCLLFLKPGLLPPILLMIIDTEGDGEQEVLGGSRFSVSFNSVVLFPGFNHILSESFLLLELPDP